jgi:YD repeat-containing protein
VKQKTWIDGYSIVFEYDPNDGRLLTATDNRGQAVKFVWNDYGVIGSADIDTNYNGLTLAADVFIDYEYAPYVGQGSFPDLLGNVYRRKAGVPDLR